MDFFEIIAILLTLSAFFSFINYKLLRLPNTIGLMLIVLLFSLLLIAIGWFVPDSKQWAVAMLIQIDFDETLLHGMLGFLLFAGALHVNINDLRQQYRIILGLATAGIVISTILVGVTGWWLFNLLGLNVPFIYCLLFGALISPTDPIAVLGILKKAGTPKSLEIKIVGESLINDGVGVVIFLILLEMAGGGNGTGFARVFTLFIQEAVGGGLLGLGTGMLAYWMLKQVDNYQVEILITLGLVTGGYALADNMHLSAPIAIVVAGLLIGNHGRSFAMSAHTRQNLDTFWQLADEVLNAVLFLLIGLEVMVLSYNWLSFAGALLGIVAVLSARLVSVSIPIYILKMFRTFSPHVVKILTWGGLRGGISIALALSLPAGPHRDTLLAVTYGVVVFSILVQGLTISTFLKILQKG
ncbi:MAG: sodium:proton antiporter [Deltaproteobacteria bacterium]|jgi:CPA1 family monovalent cation:H+ antiporter|nr:sodium:proton antiporter [Deltaproteobacteria bacterium]